MKNKIGVGGGGVEGSCWLINSLRVPMDRNPHVTSFGWRKGGFSLTLCSLVLALCLCLTFPIANAVRPRDRDALFIVKQFTDSLENQQFHHLTVDKNTGTVYVGGINRLYQYDPELQLLHQVITGPVNDSPECSPTGCKGEPRTVRPTDNFNKVLVIDYTRSRLLVCGTVRQGSCQVRDLRNISILTRNVSEAIVANNASASTVAFIAPGPPNPPTTPVLYIGVTYTVKSVYRDEVPAVTSRSLEDDRFFDFSVFDMIRSTRIVVNSLARERYPITYVYGFGSEKFSYFHLSPAIF